MAFQLSKSKQSRTAAKSAAKKAASNAAAHHAPATLTPTASTPEGVAAEVFSDILGRVVTNWAARSDVPHDVLMRAGLRNGMTPDEVNAAIQVVHDADSERG